MAGEGESRRHCCPEGALGVSGGCDGGCGRDGNGTGGLMGIAELEAHLDLKKPMLT